MTNGASARAEREYLDGACPNCGGDGKIRLVNPAWLRARRVKAGASLRDMGVRLNLSAVYLCDIERGNRAVPARVHDAYRQLRAALAEKG